MKVFVQPLVFMFTTSFSHFVCCMGVLTPVSNSYLNTCDIDTWEQYLILVIWLLYVLGCNTATFCVKMRYMFLCLAWTMSCGLAKVSVARILNLHLRCWLIHVQGSINHVNQFLFLNLKLWLCVCSFPWI